MSASATPSPYLTATIDAALSGNPNGHFLRGTDARVATRFEKCTAAHCPMALDRTSIYYRLPPGMTYLSHTGYRPVFPTCTAAAPDAGGQTIACTGNGLSGTSLGINHFSGIDLQVRLAPGMTLANAAITMAVDDSAPDTSDTLALCLADPAPSYCDRLVFAVEPGPSPDLRITSVTHTPPVFVVDAQDAQIRVQFRNLGNATPARTHLAFRLPAGFEWRAATTSSQTVGLTCSASGTVAEGQQLTCSGVGLAPPTAASDNIGVLHLGITPRRGMEQPGPLPVLIAYDSNDPFDHATLLDCADDPEQAHCAWHPVPTGTQCGTRIVAHGIYCDGFESVPALPHR